MEHPSIYETALDISPNNTLYVNNDPKTGKIDIKHLKELLDRNPDTRVVSIIGLSNITGTI
jgi:cysteine sulfinate desulfinase/cysteine desulfurase-like protein